MAASRKLRVATEADAKPSKPKTLAQAAEGDDYLEILIADQQLFAAELDLAHTRGEELRAVAQLYRALGGGWTLEEPEGDAEPMEP